MNYNYQVRDLLTAVKYSHRFISVWFDIVVIQDTQCSNKSLHFLLKIYRPVHYHQVTRLSQQELCLRKTPHKYLCKSTAEELKSKLKGVNLKVLADMLVLVGLFSFHVDVLRATKLVAEVTARRRWRLAVSFRISTGLQTDFNRPG